MKPLFDDDKWLDDYMKRRKRKQLLWAAIGLAASYAFDAYFLAHNPNKWQIGWTAVKTLIIIALLIWRARIRPQAAARGER